MTAEGKRRSVGKLSVREAEFSQLTPAGVLRPSRAPLETLGPVGVDIAVELGRAWVPVREVLEWEPGSVLRLDKVAGEPAEVLVNGCLLGRGEVVVVNERLALRLRTFREKED